MEETPQAASSRSPPRPTPVRHLPPEARGRRRDGRGPVAFPHRVRQRQRDRCASSAGPGAGAARRRRPTVGSRPSSTTTAAMSSRGAGRHVGQRAARGARRRQRPGARRADARPAGAASRRPVPTLRRRAHVERPAPPAPRAGGLQKRYGARLVVRMCIWRCTAARSSACSDRTAPARPPASTCSSAWSGPMPPDPHRRRAGRAAADPPARPSRPVLPAPGGLDLPPPDGRGEHSCGAGAAAGCRRPAAGPPGHRRAARRAAGRPVDRAAARQPGVACCPAASASVSRSRGRYHAAALSSCSTSPSPGSIRSRCRDPAHHRLPEGAADRRADHRPQRARDAGHLRPRLHHQRGRCWAEAGSRRRSSRNPGPIRSTSANTSGCDRPMETFPSRSACAASGAHAAAPAVDPAALDAGAASGSRADASSRTPFLEADGTAAAARTAVTVEGGTSTAAERAKGLERAWHRLRRRGASRQRQQRRRRAPASTSSSTSKAATPAATGDSGHDDYQTSSDVGGTRNGAPTTRTATGASAPASPRPADHLRGLRAACAGAQDQTLVEALIDSLTEDGYLADPLEGDR